MDDAASEISDMRTEGANAVVFSSDIDFNGYIPRHKEPPRYIRVRTHHKKEKEFNRMFLAQELVGTEVGGIFHNCSSVYAKASYLACGILGKMSCDGREITLHPQFKLLCSFTDTFCRPPMKMLWKILPSMEHPYSQYGALDEKISIQAAQSGLWNSAKMESISRLLGETGLCEFGQLLQPKRTVKHTRKNLYAQMLAPAKG